MAKYLIKIHRVNGKKLEIYKTLPIIAVDIEGAWQKALDFYEIAENVDSLKFLRGVADLDEYEFKDHIIKDDILFAQVDEYIEGGRIREYFIDCNQTITEE